MKFKILFLFLLASVCGWGQYSTGFEDVTIGTYGGGTFTTSSIQWSYLEVTNGAISGSDYFVGTRSARFRNRDGSNITMAQNKANGLGTISFNYRRYDTDTGQNEYRVEYSVDNGINWNLVGTFTPSNTTVSTFSQTVNVTGNIRVRIIANTSPGTTGNRRWNLDELLITNYITSTPCSGTPNAGTVSVTPTSGSPGTDYVVSSSGHSTGATGLSYQWQYNINGAGWSNTTPVNIPSSTSYANYNATNDAFAPAVGQSVQWRLVTTCSNGGASNTSSTATFTSVLSYCTPVFSNTSDYIFNFQLEDIQNNNSGFSSGGYGNFTNLSTDLSENELYNASLTSSNGSGNHGVAIWIDLNDNGTFETSERVGSLPNTVGPNVTVLIPLTIPAGNLGTHRMRVIYQWNTAGTAIDPCVSASFGEAEDYTVNITEACTPPADPIGSISGDTETCLATSLTYSGTDISNAYWQTTSTGTSTTNPASTPYAIPATPGTYTVYVRILDGDCWSASTISHTITVSALPDITAQPTDQTVTVGNPATFDVSATGTNTYQWQVDTGSGFSNVTDGSGANSASYTTVNTTLAMDGYQYRVIVTNSCGDITSSAAVLTVTEGPCYVENFDSGIRPSGWIDSGSTITYSSFYADMSVATGTITTAAFTNNPSSLKFDLARTTNGTAKTLLIQVSTSSQTSGFVTIATFDHSNTISGGTTEINLDLSAYSSFPTVYIRFNKTSGSNSPWRIDNIEVLCSDSPNPAHTYFQSKANGDWTSTATWESSEDGENWADATIYPGATAESVVIQAGNTVNINSSAVTITNTEVFGAIQVLDSNYGVDGDDVVELFVKDGGEFIVNGSGYASSGSSFGLIENGGKVIARNIPDISGAGSDFVESYLEGSAGLFFFADGGICEWDCTTTTLGTQGFSTIFEPYETGDVAILRFTSPPPSTYTMGTDSNNSVFNAVLEITDNIEINISGSGTKTFVGGIRGEGTVDVYTASGNINLGLASSVVPELGGNILLRVPTDKLKLPNGANVSTAANFVIERSDNTAENGIIDRQGGTINIYGTLDITNMRVNNSATGSIILNNGGKIRTRHTGGLFGAETAIIAYESSKLVMNEGSTAEYYGTSNQTVSNGLEYSNLEITGTGVKTGAIGNIIVNQITKVNDEAKFLILETADSVLPNVLTAKGGINVSSVAGTELVFENNAILMQDPGVTNTGSITQLRKANVPSNQYNYWSSPVVDQPLYSLYDNGLIVPTDRVMVYNPETDYFKILKKINNPLSKFGEGYSIKGPASNSSGNVTAKFIGEPNNQSSLTEGNEIEVTTFDNDDNFNLIGNPFPSNLDLDLLYWENEEVFVEITDASTPGFYFWDNVGNTAYTQQGPDYEDYYQNNYALYNPVFSGGTAAAAGPDASNKKPNGIVKPGQGFIINVKQGETSLTVNNAMRTTDIRHLGDSNDAVYFKNGNNSLATDEAERNDKFWLELVNPVNGKNQTAIGYFKQAVDTFDNYDSKVLDENVSDNIYTLSKDAVKLTIQGREGNFKNTDVIPLGVKFFVNGKYKIQLEETKGIFVSHQAVYLKDKVLDRIHNLSADGPYEIDGAAGEYTDRFEIVFKDGSTPSGPVLTTATQNKINILKRDNQIEISSSQDKITEVEIFDLSGWPVYKNHQVNSQMLRIPALSFNNQIIVVKVQTETGEIQTKKFVNQ